MTPLQLAHLEWEEDTYGEAAPGPAGWEQGYLENEMTTSEQEKGIMLEIMHARLRERDLERGRERERERDAPRILEQSWRLEEIEWPPSTWI
jgi:hypothetical protein